MIGSTQTYLLGNLPHLVGGGLELLPHITGKVLHVLNGVLGFASNDVCRIAAPDVLHGVGGFASNYVGHLADLFCGN